MVLAFDGVSRPVRFDGCADIAGDVLGVLRGWRTAEITGSERAPAITVTRAGSGYRIDSPWRKEPCIAHDRVDAVCDFIVDLVNARVADDRSLLCLHSAAAEISGRLVVFPSTYRAGKSTFVACLAAAGVRIFSDDILPIRAPDDRGVAPGVLPRPRLPLPVNASSALDDFVASAKRLHNRRYAYIDPGTGLLARHGETAAVGAFVVLRRIPGTRAVLEPMAAGEALRRVILRNFAREPDAAGILERLHALVSGVDCFTLRYDDGEEAAALVRESFRARPGRSPTAAVSAPASVRAAAFPGNSPGASPGEPAEMIRGTFRRNPAISEKALDGELFLVDADGETIFHLNAVGAGLWRLLAHPTGPGEASDILQQAFPGLEEARIADDVGRLLGALAARGLIERVS